MVGFAAVGCDFENVLNQVTYTHFTWTSIVSLPTDPFGLDGEKLENLDLNKYNLFKSMSDELRNQNCSCTDLV